MQLKHGGKDISVRDEWMGVSAVIRSFEPQVVAVWRQNCQNKYNPPPTDEELDTALSFTRGYKGPHTCHFIGGGVGRHPACDGCSIKPNQQGNTYPLLHIQAGAEHIQEELRAQALAEEEKAVMPDDLAGFEVNAFNRVIRSTGDNDEVCHPPFGILMRIQEAEQFTYEVVNANELDTPVRFPPEALNNLTKLTDFLGKIDVSVVNKIATMDLFKALTRAVQIHMHERSSIGWVSRTEFAAPTLFVTPDHMKRSRMALPPLNGKDLGIEGNHRQWYEAMLPIFQLAQPRSELYLFGLLLGLSSILPAYLEIDHRPALVSFYNPQSGTGKTTMLKLGNSWFMKYCETSIGFDDTDANMMSVIGAMKHLYSNIDEITTRIKADPIAIAKMVRQLLLGNERGRMGKGGGQWDRSEWQCQVSVSTNESLFEIANDAGLSARIMEFSVSNEDKPLSPEVFNRLETLVEKHYGCAGIHMVTSLLAGGDGMRDEANQIYAKERQTMAHMMAADPKDGTGRFRLNLMSFVMLSAHLVNRFGNAHIPINEFREWCTAQMLDALKKQENIMRTTQYTFDEFYNDILRLGCVRKSSSGDELSGLHTINRSPPFYCFKEGEFLYIRREDIHQYLQKNMRSRGTLDQWIKMDVLENIEVDKTFKQGDESLALASYLMVDYAKITTFAEDQHDPVST